MLSGNRRYYGLLSRAARTQYTEAAAAEYRISDGHYAAACGSTGKFAFIRALGDALPRGARVLDLGCGTGRYFHCFGEPAIIVGVDVSRPMLKEAQNPAIATEAHTLLIESTLHQVAFQPRSFDAVYCMGVFGSQCALDPFVAATVAGWLKPFGMFYCDVIEHFCDRSETWRSRLASVIVPYLRGAPQRHVEARLRRFTRSQREVEDILRSSFREVTMDSFVGGQGRRHDLLCVARCPIDVSRPYAPIPKI